eukprot:5727983-Pyramimonas_sp.AAC.1
MGSSSCHVQFKLCSSSCHLRPMGAVKLSAVASFLCPWGIQRCAVMRRSNQASPPGCRQSYRRCRRHLGAQSTVVLRIS